MKILAGTSGYAFKEWKGNFYPPELKDDGFLGYYATKFPAVEINNTFYRLPKENVLMEWAAQVPQNFTIALKASQRITHHARLKEESASALDFLLKNTARLGDRLGPILFQLPPNLKKDVNRFRGFLGLLAMINFASPYDPSNLPGDTTPDGDFRIFGLPFTVEDRAERLRKLLDEIEGL